MHSSTIPPMQGTDVLTNCIFRVGLPTADVVTDFILAIKLLFGFTTYGDSHPKFGIAMLCPILFSMIFIFYQWYRTEYKSTKSKIYKILTCIMVMVQFYPQFKTLEIIWYGYWRRDPVFNWKEEKAKLMLNIGSLGKYYFICCLLCNYFNQSWDKNIQFNLLILDIRPCHTNTDFS